jgi:hypothetical protein
VLFIRCYKRFADYKHDAENQPEDEVEQPQVHENASGDEDEEAAEDGEDTPVSVYRAGVSSP